MEQFSCVFSMVLFAKRHIFQCGWCKMQTLHRRSVVKMQTEGKVQINSKQTNLIQAKGSKSLV